jgi:hypothetical protein
MRYDQYGRPIMPHQSNYGQAPQPHQGYNNNYHAPNDVQAVINMPNMSELGGQGAVPWVRFPFFPRVGTQTRFYGATLLYTDGDYAANQEAIRIVQFDIPCRLIAINAAATFYDSITNKVCEGFVQVNPLNTFLFRAEYTTGDKLHTSARLASTVVGDMMNPGELGGTGYTIDQGASLVLGLTPLALSNNAATNEVKLRIDITLHCLEIRGPSNFTRG